MKLPEQERHAYSRYSDDLHYQASMVESSYGVGRLKGREEGREEGRAEGRKEERIKMAASLMEILDDHIIAEKTGLTLAEVQEIRSVTE